MKISVQLEHEKSAPKSHAYGARTEDGILVKVWIPHSLVAKPLGGIEVDLNFPEGKKKGRSTKKKRRDEDEEDE